MKDMLNPPIHVKLHVKRISWIYPYMLNYMKDWGLGLQYDDKLYERYVESTHTCKVTYKKDFLNIPLHVKLYEGLRSRVSLQW